MQGRRSEARRGKMVVAPASALAVAWCFAAGAAATGATTSDAVVFEWTAPPACPGAGEMRAEVVRLVGHELEASAGRLEVRVRVARDAAGVFHMRLETHTSAGAGERTLDGADCGAIAGATALIIALAIDPGAVMARGSASPASVPTAAATPVAPVPATTPSAREDKDGEDGGGGVVARRIAIGRGLRGSLRAGLIGDVGTLPGPTAGPAVTAGVRLWRGRTDGALALHAEIAGAYLWPARATLAAKPDVGGRIGLWTAGARVCPAFEFGAWSARVCASVETGVIQGRGFGVENEARGRAFWLAVGGGGALAVNLASWLAIYGELGAHVPLTRPVFVLENVGSAAVSPVHEPAPVSGRAGLGFMAHFGR